MRPEGRKAIAEHLTKVHGTPFTPEEVTVAYESCKKSFTTFTEVALCQHFGRAQHERMGAAKRDIEPPGERESLQAGTPWDRRNFSGPGGIQPPVGHRAGRMRAPGRDPR